METKHENWQSVLAEAPAFRRQHGRPLVSLCYAQSLDGSLTVQRGQPTALSGIQAMRLTHRLRAAHDAILIGVGTVLADDPRLTVRLVEGHDPQPIILDSRLRTPPDAYLLQSHPRPAWIATTENAPAESRRALQSAGARLLDIPATPHGRLDLSALLDCLGAQGIDSLMVEGGATIIASFLAHRLVDQFILTVAPLFVGGLHIGDGEKTVQTMPLPLPRAAKIEYTHLGDDLIVWGRF